MTRTPVYKSTSSESGSGGRRPEEGKRRAKSIKSGGEIGVAGGKRASDRHASGGESEARQGIGAGISEQVEGKVLKRRHRRLGGQRGDRGRGTQTIYRPLWVGGGGGRRLICCQSGGDRGVGEHI